MGLLTGMVLGYLALNALVGKRLRGIWYLLVTVLLLPACAAATVFGLLYNVEGDCMLPSPATGIIGGIMIGGIGLLVGIVCSAIKLISEARKRR